MRGFHLRSFLFSNAIVDLLFVFEAFSSFDHGFLLHVLSISAFIAIEIHRLRLLESI